MKARPNIPHQMALLIVGACALAGVLALWWLKPSQPRLIPPAEPGSLFGTSIQLELGKKKWRSLQEERAEALKVGVLRSDGDSWVKAKLKEGNEEWKVRLRLKGDWTDHLEGDKWSYRVEVRDSLRPMWRRMPEFSLHSPERRAFLLEWLFHEALRGEGLLTTSYEFVQLGINGRDHGIYALEEHFGKELLERQHRREGPIVRIDEEGMWDARVEAIRDSSFPYLQTPFFEAAAVLPYGKSRLLDDPQLHAQWDQAQRLMAQYRLGTASPADVLDLRLAARQYALTDLFGTYHSLIWHNRKFYLNPVTLKLEPVVYDGYSGPDRSLDIRFPFWGYALHGQLRDDRDYRDQTSVFAFQDTSFVRAYFHELERMCRPAYLDSLLAAQSVPLAKRASLLQSEWPSYEFDPTPLRQNARVIRAVLYHVSHNPRIKVSSLNIAKPSLPILVRNQGPLPLEFQSLADTLSPPHYLDADCGQPDQSRAWFWTKGGTPLRYRIPGTTPWFTYDWTAL